MQIIRYGRVFNVNLVDDGTLDTVIEINGEEHRFVVERHRDGSLDDAQLTELADVVIDNMDPEEIDAGGRTEESTLLEPDCMRFNRVKQRAQELHKQYGRTYLICRRVRDGVYEIHSDIHASCWPECVFLNVPVVCVIA